MDSRTILKAHVKGHIRTLENGHTIWIATHETKRPGRAAMLHERTSLGQHKDGSHYLRATDKDDAATIEHYARRLNIKTDKRTREAEHLGQKGKFVHFHMNQEDAVKLHHALHGAEDAPEEIREPNMLDMMAEPEPEPEAPAPAVEPQAEPAPIVETPKAENPTRMTYAKAVKENLEHMGTPLHEWSACPIKSMKSVEIGNGRSKMMPEYEIPAGYSQAPTMFPGEGSQGCCGLCGTNIKEAHHLQNDTKKWTLTVGSECVTHFGTGESGNELAKKAKNEQNKAAFTQAVDARDALFAAFWPHAGKESREWFASRNARKLAALREAGWAPKLWTNPDAYKVFRSLHKMTLDSLGQSVGDNPATMTRWVGKNGNDAASHVLAADAILTAAGKKAPDAPSIPENVAPAPVPAPAPPGPAVGDTKTEDGTTYRLNENSRWEKVEDQEEPAPAPAAEEAPAVEPPAEEGWEPYKKGSNVSNAAVPTEEYLDGRGDPGYEHRVTKTELVGPEGDRYDFTVSRRKLPEPPSQPETPVDVDALKRIGAEWQKDDKHRIYFNNISKLTGMPVPKGSKLYFDIKDNQFHGRDIDAKDIPLLAEAIKKKASDAPVADPSATPAKDAPKSKLPKSEFEDRDYVENAVPLTMKWYDGNVDALDVAHAKLAEKPQLSQNAAIATSKSALDLAKTGSDLLAIQKANLTASNAMRKAAVAAKKEGKPNLASLFFHMETQHGAIVNNAGHLLAANAHQPDLIPDRFKKQEMKPPEPAHIATFQNPEEGMSSIVTKGTNGFHVAVKDNDSGTILPTITKHATEAEAIAHATKIAGVTGPKAGDERTVNGRTYRLTDGRWRRVGEDGQEERLGANGWTYGQDTDPTVEAPAEASAEPPPAAAPAGEDHPPQDGHSAIRQSLTVQEPEGTDFDKKYGTTYILKDGVQVAKVGKWSNVITGKPEFSITKLTSKKQKSHFSDPNEIIPACATIEDALDKYAMSLFAQEEEKRAKAQVKKDRAAKVREAKRARAIAGGTPTNRQEATRAAFDEPEAPEPVKQEPYYFKPEMTHFQMGGVDQTIQDFTAIIPRRISLANRKTVLDQPRPGWVPEISDDWFGRCEGRLEGVKLGEDRYIICTDRPRGQRMGYYETGGDDRKYALTNLAGLVATQDYYSKRQRAKHDMLLATSKVVAEHTANVMKWMNEHNTRGNDGVEDFLKTPELPEKLMPGMNEERRRQVAISALAELNTWRVQGVRGYQQGDLDWYIGKFKEGFEKRVKKDAPRIIGSNNMTYSHQDTIARVKPSPNSTPGKFQKGRTDTWAEFHDFLNDLKQGSSDMELQMEETANSHSKGQETSYGRGGSVKDLLDSHGVVVKRQNGDEISDFEVEEIRDALDSVYSVFGDRSALAGRTKLLISHSGDVLQHARKASGLYHSGRNAIGVTWQGGQTDAGFTLAHEFAHFMDNQLGQIGGKQHYASDDRNGLEYRIAHTFRTHMEQKQKSDYQNRTCECFARALEMYFAAETGEQEHHQSWNSLGNHPSQEDFQRHVKPIIEQFFQEKGPMLKAFLPRGLKTA